MSNALDREKLLADTERAIAVTDDGYGMGWTACNKRLVENIRKGKYDLPEKTCHRSEKICEGGFWHTECTNCGKWLDSDYSFCPSCGAKIVEVQDASDD